MPILQPTRFSHGLRSRLLESREVTGGGYLVRIYPADITAEPVMLADQSLVIGRDVACDLELDDDSVSRRHATLESTDAGYCVADLGSTNGTYVNEARIERQLLQGGDRVRFGNQIFKFLSADEIEAQFHETVYKMITTDGLTQVYNKRYLLEVVEREVQRTERTAQPLSILMFDVDKFKSINDTHGHLAGDEVLVELCRRAQSLLRRDEVLARYGGEEFTLVLSDTPLAQAREVAERLRQAIADQPFRTEHATFPVTVSVGLAVTFGLEPLTAAELLSRADKQLYAAKQAGRNRVMG